jgi:uncharacterized protein (DUF302 family)
MSSPTVNTSYGFGKTLNLPFGEAVTRVTHALQAEGFGVLTDIDVAATVKSKLDIDMPAYRILGACNPALAHRAIATEPSIGLLLPCNVVVREDVAGTVFAEIMDPEALMRLVNRAEISELGAQVRRKLERVLAAL